MLNVSSPSPLFEEQNSSLNYENLNKKNISMLYTNDPSSRPTLNNEVNKSNQIFNNEDNVLNFQYEFKIILLGPIAVGKTSILSRYITNNFDKEHNCTIKSEFKVKVVNVNNNTKAKLNIWDTCGDEKFRAITRQYYKEAQGVLLIYDISDRNSFDNIEIWAEDIKNCAPENCVVTLVANKCDLTDKRVVSTQEGKNKADQLGYLFNEVSAKTGDNILLLFQNISEAILKQYETNKNEQTKQTTQNIKYLEDLVFTNKRENKKSFKCC